MAETVIVIDHPLVQHKLTLLRQAETSAAVFRALLREISMLLAYEVTRDMPLTYERINTPLASMHAPVLAGKKLVVVSIMRAGNGILDGMLEIIPSARVGACPTAGPTSATNACAIRIRRLVGASSRGACATRISWRLP